MSISSIKSSIDLDKLKKLDVSMTVIGDDAMEVICGSFHDLEELYATSTRISDNSIHLVCELRGLKKLSVSLSNLLTSDGIKPLARLPVMLLVSES